MQRESGRKRQILRDVVVLYALTAGLLIALFKDRLLPERFAFDSDKIQAIAQGRVLAYDESYQRTTDIYRSLNLQDSPTLAGVLGYLVAALALVIVLRKSRSSVVTMPVLVLIAATAVLSAVFLAFYTKDVFVFLPVLGVLVAPPGRRGLLVTVACIVAYAMWFRAYWLVVLAIYLGALWLIRRRARFSRLILAVLAASAAASAALWYVLNLPPDYYRENANTLRDVRFNASTAITDFVSFGDPLGGVVNNLLTSITLVAPYPLVQLGSAYHLLLAVGIFALWLMFFRALRGLMKSDRLDGDPLTARAAALVLAFAATQGMFEPDYGSALRHLTPLLPLMLLVTWRAAAKGESVAVGEDRPADHLPADVDA